MKNEGFLLLNLYALIVLIILCIIFFNQNKRKNLENDIYTKLLLTSVITITVGLLLGTVLNFNFKYINLILNIFNKVYLIGLVSIISLFGIYTFCISKFGRNKEEKAMRIYNIFNIINILIIMILPIDIINDSNTVVARGLSVYYTYTVYGLIYLSLVTIVLLDFKHIKDKKYIPIIFLICGGVFVVSIVILFPKLNYIINPSTVLNCLIMYFTIENPDLKMLEELEFQKEQVENSKNISNKVINAISDNLSESINKISSFGHEKFNYNNIEEVKSEVTSMQKFALEYIDNLDSLMELSKTQSEGFEIVNTKYEPLQVLDEIEDVLTVKNNNINIIINKISDIPPVIYGDPVKIKQILLHLYNGILKISNLKDINLDISYLTVGSLCRFKVCTEIYLNDLINEYTKELKNNTIDFEVIDRIVKMIDGKFNIILKDNAVKIEILINQKYIDGYYVVEEVNTLNKKINYMNLSNKNILIVDDDKNRINKLMNILSNYNCNIAVSTDYDSTIKECNDKVFDLIIIDDIISDIDRIKNYLLIDNSNGLLKVMDHIEYEVPRIIMVTPNTEGYENKYIEEGFDNIISKPIDKYKIDNLIKYFFDNKDAS